MKQFLTFAALLCCAVALSTAVLAADNNGKAAPPPQKKAKPILFASGHGTTFKIVVPSRMSLPEYTGALELQKAIRDMALSFRNSGEIVTADKVPDAPAKSIVIGTIDSPLIQPVADQLKLKKSPDDEIAIHVIDGNIYLAGNSPRATLYAVYDFMRKYMKVKWLWPGEGGTFYTSNWCSVPADLAYNYKPTFRFRMISLQEKDSDESRFFNARNFVHDQDFRFGGDRYTGGEAISPRRSDFKEHPEWFAVKQVTKEWFEKNPDLCAEPVVKGDKVLVRYLPPPTGWSWVINGCWSNEEFTKACVERVKETIRQQHANHVSLHPADDMGRCLCDKCKAMIDPDESTRWYDYHAGLVRELKKEFPDIRYSVLAYQEYYKVPKHPVKEVEFVEYCNYRRCFIHKIDNPNCASNRSDFKTLDDWIHHQVGDKVPVGLWDYTYDMFNPMLSVPVYSYFADLIRYCAKNELVKIYFENGNGAKKSRPATWIAAQMMWDASADPEKLLNEYCKTAYGPGEKPMADYHRACAKAWEAMPIHLSQCFNNPAGTSKVYLNKELIALAEKSFAEAEKAIRSVKIDTKNKAQAERAKTLQEKQLAAVEFEKEMFREWLELHEKMMKDSVMLTIFKGSGDSDFENFAVSTPKFQTRAKKQSDKVKSEIYWTDDALLVKVSYEDPKYTPSPFKLNKDGNGAFSTMSAEVFVQPSGSPTYNHFAVGEQGDYYEGEAMSGAWNGEWTFDRKAEKGKYSVTFKLPFKTLGKTPVNGETWKLLVIFADPETGPVGVPYTAHHDIGAGADLVFNEGKRP